MTDESRPAPEPVLPLTGLRDALALLDRVLGQVGNENVWGRLTSGGSAELDFIYDERDRLRAVAAAALVATTKDEVVRCRSCATRVIFAKYGEWLHVSDDRATLIIFDHDPEPAVVDERCTAILGTTPDRKYVEVCGDIKALHCYHVTHRTMRGECGLLPHDFKPPAVVDDKEQG